jgi:DNA repair protein RecO (recombination protein O)
MATRPARQPSLASYVLHHYDWSESSLILDLFTREQGRIAVAAKGAKRPFSQLRSVLLPFQRLQISLGRPPAGDDTREVQTLRAAEWAGGHPMLTGPALFSGFYLNELLMKLLARHDPHAALFDAYAATVARLAEGDEAEPQAALRAFEIVLLKEIGLLPDLATETPRAGRSAPALSRAGRCRRRRADSAVGRIAARPSGAQAALAADSGLQRVAGSALRAAAVAAGAASRISLRSCAR